MDRAPPPSRLRMEVKRELVARRPDKALTPLQVPMSHQQWPKRQNTLSSHAPSYAARKALLCRFITGVSHTPSRIYATRAWHRRLVAACPVNPDLLLLPPLQKKTPHNLCGSESAQAGWCPADFGPQKSRRRADAETKLNTQAQREPSYI